MRPGGRWAALAAALLALVGVVAGAQAQGVNSGGFVLFGIPGVKTVSEINIPVTVDGELTVAFHGDAGTGCAAAGLCGYSGTIVARPGSGALSVTTYRRRGRVGHLVELAFAPVLTGYTTAALVQRSSPGGQGGTCEDAQTASFGTAPTQPVHGNSVTVTLLGAGGSLLATRCAGPLDSDLQSAVPTATMPLRTLERGGVTVDLSGTRPFAAHGYAGTITSSVVLKLGKPQKSPSQTSFPPGVKTAQIRTVTEKLSVDRMDGDLRAAVSGTADPIVCRLLDTCGLSGTLGLAPAVREVSAEAIAMGPASRPYDDFLTALGLRSGPRPRGIAAVLFVVWGGQVTANLTQSGGSCSDTAPDGGIAVDLSVSAANGKLAGVAASSDSWRTRCPGPSFENAGSPFTASASPGALSRARIKIEVHPGAPFGDDGYVVSPSGSLSVVLRRGRISQVVATAPTG